MKILITGGCGFLGSNLAAAYLQEGAEVTVIDALFRNGSATNLACLESQAAPGRLHFSQTDLADANGVLAVFRRHAPFDYICHVGGQVAMTTSLTDPARDLLTNVLEPSRARGRPSYSPEALIAYSSTNKVYGDLECSAMRRPLDAIYSRSSQRPRRVTGTGFLHSLRLFKGAADQYVRDWARVYGLKTVVFRHSSIFGGRQFASFDQGWVGWFCQKAIEQKRAHLAGFLPEPFTIAGTGKQVRDVLHADDLIGLYRTAYEHREQMKGEIFNIGGGASNSLSLLELFDILAELLAIPPLIYTPTPRRASDQDCFIADIGKAERVLGWTPAISCREGISSMLTWTEKHLIP